MAKFVKGDIVVIPFPFSDLSGTKKRPAFVLSDLPGDDIILCQITSQQTSGSFMVTVYPEDFLSGSLPVSSYIKPARIFTADKNIIIRKAGTVNPTIIERVTKVLLDILT